MAAALGATLPASPSGLDSEFSWNESDFHAVRRLIGERAGIRLNEGKQAMVYSRLARRLRATGHCRFGDYLAWLCRQDESADEWQEFVNALTTNLTSFFREPHHFDLLAQHAALGGRRRWRGWCCAASTGEEPYSIAMTLDESLPAGASWQLLASDIDTSVLATAREGVYPAERIEALDPQRLRRHFLRGTGSNQGRVRVLPRLQTRVWFERINLMEAHWPIEPGLDFVFCRNVLIYFDLPAQRELVRRLQNLLAPGGLLFVGHAESLVGLGEHLRPLGRTAYVKA